MTSLAALDPVPVLSPTSILQRAFLSPRGFPSPRPAAIADGRNAKPPNGGLAGRPQRDDRTTATVVVVLFSQRSVLCVRGRSRNNHWRQPPLCLRLSQLLSQRSQHQHRYPCCHAPNHEHNERVSVLGAAKSGSVPSVVSRGSSTYGRTWTWEAQGSVPSYTSCRKNAQRSVCWGFRSTLLFLHDTPHLDGDTPCKNAGESCTWFIMSGGY